MAQLTVELVNRLGLHARAAAKFVHITSRFSSQVLVRHNDEEVNGKSILGLLLLAAPCGSQLTITRQRRRRGRGPRGHRRTDQGPLRGGGVSDSAHAGRAGRLARDRDRATGRWWRTDRCRSCGCRSSPEPGRGRGRPAARPPQSAPPSISSASQRTRSPRSGAEYASIFEAHRLMLEDPTLLDEVERLIRERGRQRRSGRSRRSRTSCSRSSRSSADVYLRERQTDLLDVAAQLQRALQGRARRRHSGHSGELGILVADDIPPSQAIQLAQARSQRLRLGDRGDHLAHDDHRQVARHPGRGGRRRPRRRGREGAPGHRRRLRGPRHRRPRPSAWSRCTACAPRSTAAARRSCWASRTSRPTTLDGHVVTPARQHRPASTRSPRPRPAGAEGIGLFRSEFLFLQASPDLAGRGGAGGGLLPRSSRRFPDGPVTVRTFDLGGKKLARELLGSPEANPVLGLRGVRLCLQKPDFFRTQLRALLRAAGRGLGTAPHHGAARRPRRGDPDRPGPARASQRGAATRGRMPSPTGSLVGAMIEVPAAAMIAEHLAREVDFFAHRHQRPHAVHAGRRPWPTSRWPTCTGRSTRPCCGWSSG